MPRGWPSGPYGSSPSGGAAAGGGYTGWRPSGATMGYQPAWRVRGPAIGAVGGPEMFDVGSFAAGMGFQATTPTGQRLATGSWGNFAQMIQREYGVDPQEFLGMTQEQQYGAWAGTRGLPGTYEEMQAAQAGGAAARPPESPREAGWMQFQAGQEARTRSQEMLQNAVSTMQYAAGLLRQGGPGSLATALSPQMSQLAQIYAQTEVSEPDYSAWLMPGMYGVQEEEVPGGQVPLTPIGQGIAVGAPGAGGGGWSSTGYPT